jgi:uncharacterized repeat protein (TIGR03803 family)
MSSGSFLLGFRLALCTAGSIALVVAAAAIAKAPNETVLYNFTGGSDGANPSNGSLIIDSSGALYGTTVYGGTLGAGGDGTVYKLTPHRNGWTRTVLHSFPPTGSTPGPDGVNPFAGVIFGSDGALYGTTVFGGNSGNGTVYKLTPPSSGTVWNETVLYNFMGGADGRYGSSSLIFDSSGALYGTAGGGGNSGNGTVYKLTPPSSGTVWNFTLLYAFAGGGADGALPSYAPLIFDRSGALYGTTRSGGPCSGCGSGFGTVYKLTPPAPPVTPGTPWTETVLHFFTGFSDGNEPDGGVIFDAHGSLYGTTSQGGAGWGTVYKLTPPAKRTTPESQWTKTVLHNFSAAPDGNNPYSGLIFDPHGNLYGTTSNGGSDAGTVFQVAE